MDKSIIIMVQEMSGPFPYPSRGSGSIHIYTDAAWKVGEASAARTAVLQGDGRIL